MEVHHHAHTPRKKWTHYFWEFLMLFLAVFCGFLAENFREHRIEKEREKKYIKSMVADLAEDTTRLNRAVSRNVEKFNNMDSLIYLLQKKQLSEDDETSLYSFYFQSVGLNSFISNDRTSRQLLNSGNMRLIEKANISDSIIEYYGPNLELNKLFSDDIKYFTYEANLFSQDIFDFSAVRTFLGKDSTMNYEFNNAKMKLLTNDKKIVEKYANKNAACKGLLGNYLQHLLKLKKRAISLIALLKKEYHLK